MIDLIVVAVVCICVGMSLGIQIGVCIGRKQAIENPKKEAAIPPGYVGVHSKLS